jgi:hypothetical protein
VINNYAANIPLIEKYANELGVRPEEIVNIANLTQQGGAAGDLNYFLTGGGQNLIDARAGKNVMYDPSQGSYIKALIDRFHSGATNPDNTKVFNGEHPFTSLAGYDAKGNFVGDLSGGRPIGDLTHVDPATGQTIPSLYGWNPQTNSWGYIDADGNPLQGSYTGPTVTAGSYTSPTWQGGKYVGSTVSKAAGGEISGGLGALQNEYAAGGKLLRGAGDGMSDSIPAVIRGEQTQRAALADGEFVIPADVVSHLGNGSTDAGSRKLYAMMNKVRKARTGNPNQGKQIDPDKYMPA